MTQQRKRDEHVYVVSSQIYGQEGLPTLRQTNIDPEEEPFNHLLWTTIQFIEPPLCIRIYGD